MSIVHHSEKEVKKAKQVMEDLQVKQDRYDKISRELNDTLKEYNGKFSFKYSKNQVIFAVNIDGVAKIGVANCSSFDKFDKTLGKAIAVRKAFGKRINDIVELVEPKPNPFAHYVKQLEKSSQNKFKKEYLTPWEF